MNKTYLLLGSNLGDSIGQLAAARLKINGETGRIIRASSVYKTRAWGKEDQPDFYNQVIVVETSLNARQTLASVLGIELEMGRVRKEKNDPRTIDIDILFFNKEVISEPQLKIPHPAIQLRRFVLVPLNEISPRFIHPVLLTPIHQLLFECTDKLEVKKI